MEQHGKLIHQIAGFVKEQHAINRDQKSIIRSLQQMLQQMSRTQQKDSLRHMVRAQQEDLREHRRERKASERRWQAMFREHNQWMKDHGVRLRYR